jgi:eukaryotic-like serine/threonine-protein kinase
MPAGTGLGSSTMTPQTRLSELLMHWEELRLQGKAVTAEELCSDSPELVEELRRRIRAREAADPMLTVTPGQDSATVSRPAAPPTEPRRPSVPGYDVLDELGRGGMGVVYRVRNVAIDRIEALKMMRARAAPHPHGIPRFQLEIRATAQFEHPRVTRKRYRDPFVGNGPDAFPLRFAL